ncbi:hypothetical protein L596_010199 [Steinernema carpocapsae]|uniref:Uncharacterized protein n=1 Tax=Steinernema carpocapsae TaxID=34508 RepID=A0A4U5PI63_STECR|nr:hypothetical protein L596_010199 [Steinernema carpocapsae]
MENTGYDQPPPPSLNLNSKDGRGRLVKIVFRFTKKCKDVGYLVMPCCGWCLFEENAFCKKSINSLMPKN